MKGKLMDDGMEDEAFPPLPPPLSPGNDEGEVSRLDDVPEAKRKSVKRPQPKLDSNRLTSARGLPALRTLFDDTRFRGQGHEQEDLHVLMSKMENWAHRLFPKLQFEDFIDRVERLGSKKDVQTCLKRIRLDMPLIHEDFGGEEGAEEQVEPETLMDSDPFNESVFPPNLQWTVSSTPAPQPAPIVSPEPPSLTEEQQQRMEMNKRKALERRLARQKLSDHKDEAEAINNSTQHMEEEFMPTVDPSQPESQFSSREEPPMMDSTPTVDPFPPENLPSSREDQPLVDPTPTVDPSHPGNIPSSMEEPSMEPTPSPKSTPTVIPSPPESLPSSMDPSVEETPHKDLTPSHEAAQIQDPAETGES